jgi:hypothetical protein
MGVLINTHKHTKHVIGPAVINTHICGAWVGFGSGFGIPPHTLLSFSPPSFHTISLSLAFTSA